MEKYYTPVLEEFHIGFEFEIYVFHIVENRLEYQWKSYNLNTIEKLDKLINESQNQDFKFRVKYLDTEDIASLGFEHLGSGWFEKDIYRIRKWSEQEIDVYLWNTLDASIPGHLIFRGEIKNRSELKQLLKQLHIK